ncbi:hypothetical protein [Vibrio sp. Of14-4]|uniref:hypothetical protein n=1 Tax=Vibrio sp. Of14-4 TaxID=2724878 RepID=UPI001EF2432D|nr:hypothetical protein [Vibrio sp. Of14-4]
MKKIISIMTLVLLSGCASKYQPSPPVEKSVWVKDPYAVVATPEELKAAKDKCDFDNRLSAAVDSFNYKTAVGSDKYNIQKMNEDFKRYKKVRIEVLGCMLDLGYYQKKVKVSNTEKN